MVWTGSETGGIAVCTGGAPIAKRRRARAAHARNHRPSPLDERPAHLDHGLPSFFVVGPPRTGTTWLHEILSRSINLPSPTKETRYFDLHFDKGHRWYMKHFRKLGDGRPVGEVAPTYFASPCARERISCVVPHAKIVFIFRHPVQRLVSLYRLKRAYGMLNGSLEHALERDPELMESSRYATGLEAWLNYFPHEQLSVQLYEDLAADPQVFVDDLVRFLEIPSVSLKAFEVGRIRVNSSVDMTEPKSYLATRAATAMANWCKARELDHIVAGVRNSRLMSLFLGGGAPFPEVPEQTIGRIASLLLPEIERLETMLDRDLSHWKRSPA